MSLLEIRDLRIEFGRGEQARRAVDGVSLSIQSGETLCLVGESGSGKSVTALSMRGSCLVRQHSTQAAMSF
jgi:ABC-type dipeptide/oligopeptide/nickel transport system ATPase component